MVWCKFDRLSLEHLLASNIKQKVKSFQILLLFPVTLISGCIEGERKSHLKSNKALKCFFYVFLNGINGQNKNM